MCPDSVSDVRVHSRARAGPRAERRPRRTRFVAIDGDLGWAPTGAPPLQKFRVEGDSGASGVAIGLVGGSRAVGRGKVAGSGVRAPSSAVKNSLAGCRFPAAGGESFSTRPKTSILHDPRGIPNRSELAGEADVDTADLLCVAKYPLRIS